MIRCAAPLQWIAAAALLACSASSSFAQDIAIRGKRVHTMAGESIENGVIIIRDGKIASVGADLAIPDGMDVLEANVVTPGLIDAHATVGVSGIYNTDHDQDQLERSEPIQPELRAIDAFNTDDRLVSWVRQYGVTTVHTGHAPGELISGQTIVTKTAGNTVDAALLQSPAALAITLAESAKKSGKQSPGSRSKMMSLLRTAFIEADAYEIARATDPENGPKRDLRKEALVLALRRDIPVMITAHRAQDIASALRLAREFQLRLILDGAAEAYLLVDDIKAAGVPVIMHPTMVRGYGDLENMSFETAATLVKAGISVTMQSGYEAYVPKTRVVLFEAAMAAANGLTFDQALACITIEAARLLDLDTRIGSIEVGKDGDIAMYDGDPFEYTTHCTGVIIDGVPHAPETAANQPAEQN